MALKRFRDGYNIPGKIKLIKLMSQSHPDGKFVEYILHLLDECITMSQEGTERRRIFERARSSYLSAMFSMLKGFNANKICSQGKKCFAMIFSIWCCIFKLPPKCKTCAYACCEDIFIAKVYNIFGPELENPLIMYKKHPLFAEFIRAVLAEYPILFYLNEIEALAEYVNFVEPEHRQKSDQSQSFLSLQIQQPQTRLLHPSLLLPQMHTQSQQQLYSLSHTSCFPLLSEEYNVRIAKSAILPPRESLLYLPELEAIDVIINVLYYKLLTSLDTSVKDRPGVITALLIEDLDDIKTDGHINLFKFYDFVSCTKSVNERVSKVIVSNKL